MASYKLYYFDGRGAAELARLVFKQAGVDFEDIRYTGEEWPQHKSEMPLGAMPVLEVDGRKICQSLAIARYLAKEFGLFGSNNMEAFVIDELFEIFAEIMNNHLWKIFYEEDENKKAELAETFKKDSAAKYLNLIEKRLKENTSGSGFYVGSEVTVGDLLLYNSMYANRKWLGQFSVDVYEGRPLLEEHFKLVGVLPNIAKWVQERPETAF
ncbi:glutathione S-transferase 1-like isoform X2 [Dreissena polymorpha]|uniref:glutathione S-transferase 1-like isoform X2 n=1 Tax=Dreissena polymorpha TaxID=45954 RepID=UPI002264799C|nr:glutathione S-transferase 1-like isoform X2 [Dreissena polymorpha]